MQIKVMTWLSIAALLATITFWRSAPNFQIELNLIVTIAAAIVLIHAFQAKKYPWAAGFLAIALLFNPAMPMFPLAGGIGLTLVILSIALFAVSLTILRPRPLMSIPSITGRNPGSLSL